MPQPQSQTEVTPQDVTPKPAKGKSYNLKVKQGEKWMTLGTIFIRADMSGGVATLFKDAATALHGIEDKLEKVAVFPVDGKYSSKKAA